MKAIKASAVVLLAAWAAVVYSPSDARCLAANIPQCAERYPA
jgi:hypothetical protein